MLFLSIFFSFFLSFTSAAEPSPCFDFSAKITAPLKSFPAATKESADLTDLGSVKALSGDYDWAYISGIVAKPVSAIYQKLLDPKTIRNDSNTKIEIKEKASPYFLKLIEQSITVKPVFFLTLEWVENWSYSLLSGTAEAPKSILVSYEKMSGTSHIDRLCGNISVTALPASDPKKPQTLVTVYETIKADRREAKDVQKGITGTLRTLRE